MSETTCYRCEKPIEEGKQSRDFDPVGDRHEWCLSDKSRKWLADRFEIPEDEVVWYNSGICYSRIQVKTKEAADKVTAAVKGKTANGGMLHGMQLGGQQPQKDGTIEVYC